MLAADGRICPPGWSRRAFASSKNLSTASAIDAAQRILWLCVAVVLVAMIGARWILAGQPGRRTLAPVLAGAATVLVFSLYVIVDEFDTVPTPLLWGLLAAYTAVPIALLVSMLRARLARSSVADLFLGVWEDEEPFTVARPSSGTLAASQAAQTISAHGTPVVGGALSKSQAANAESAAGARKARSLFCSATGKTITAGTR